MGVGMMVFGWRSFLRHVAWVNEVEIDDMTGRVVDGPARIDIN